MEHDLTREKILESLYSQHTSARSRSSQMVGIRDLSRLVKKLLPKVKENEVASNVTFLVQNNLVEEVAVENYFAKKNFGGAKPSYKYRLSRDGLAYFEHGSRFDRGNIFAGIGDITGSGNYIIIGNQNNISGVTNTSYTEGHQLAEDLRRKVNALGEFSDDEKISIQSDIETIKNQLAKSAPDKTILEKAKGNISFLADIATVAGPAVSLINWLSTNFKI